MKRIIDGKRYDTDTATQIWNWGNGLCRGDFKRIRTALYRTNRGAWFLAGEGGAMTEYAERYADGARSNGEKIIPCTEAEALAWLETHDGQDVIEKYLHSAIEDA